MLDFLKRGLATAGRHRLRRRLPGDDGPGGYLDLCDRLLRDGRAEDAIDVAGEGLERFPRSLELADRLRILARGNKEGTRVGVLAAKATTVRTPEAFTELIAEGEAIGELDVAVAAAADFTAGFPDLPAAWLERARVHERRFDRELVARDALCAIDALERVVVLSVTPAEAHRRLVALHARIGTVSRALFHFYKLRDCDPSEPDLTAMESALSELPLEERSLSEQLREIEESDRPCDHRPSDPAASAGLRARIEARLRALATRPHFVRAAFLHPEFEILLSGEASRTGFDPDSDHFREIVAGFRRTVAASSKRLGLGAPHEMEIQADPNLISACFGRGSLLLVETNSVRRPDPPLMAAVRDLVCAADRASAEPPHE